MRFIFAVSACALALAGACALPAATLQGTGGMSSSSASNGSSSGSGGGIAPPRIALTTVDVVNSGPAVVAPSGNPGQKHVVHVAGAWFVFSFDLMQNVTWSAAADANPTMFLGQAAAIGLPKPVMMGTTPLDGRVFGVDAQIIGGAPVVHFGFSLSNVSKPLASHQRGTIDPQHVIATPMSMLPMDPNAIPWTLNGGAIRDGVVTAFYPADQHVYDFEGLQPCGGPQPSGACVRRSTQKDDGSPQWMNGFDPPSRADEPGDTFGTVRAALAVGQDLLTLWSDEQALRSSVLQGSTWMTRIEVQRGLAGARQWAACAQDPGSGHPSPRARVAMQFSSGFEVDSCVDCKAWGREAKAPPSPKNAVGDLFLVCGPETSYLFGIGAAGDWADQIVVSAQRGADADWSEWGIVAAQGAHTHRCSLSGVQELVNQKEIGLIWTDSPDCSTRQPEHVVFGHWAGE